MRVLAVSQSYYPYLREGGRPTKVRAIALGLSGRGHDVTVLTADLGPFELPSDSGDFRIGSCDFGYCARDNSTEVIYLRSTWRRRTVTLNSGLLRFCRSKLSDIDIVHIFGIYDLIGPVVAAHCQRRSIPYVVETMGMFRPFSRTILGKQVYHRVVGRRLIRQAKRVIATSEREREELLEGGVPGEQIVVRANGVDWPRPVGPNDDFRMRQGIRPDARLILFLARIIPLKSPDLLLRAFARFVKNGEASDSRPWHLVIAGPQEEPEYHVQLVALARSLRIDSAVTFAPPLYGDDKWQAYRAASIFVLPSTSENFGNSAAEAIASGVPVIVTDRCGIARFVQKSKPQPGVVIGHDESELAEALARLSSDEALYRSLQAGCEVAAGRLGWDEPINQLESLYTELAVGHS